MDGAHEYGYSEDQLLMISGIQHFAFCPRQWGLIHLEQQWEDNVLTYEGSRMHRRADNPMLSEIRGDVLISRAMPLVSYRLGLYGVADVVEFHAVADAEDLNKARLKGRRGWWLPYPVEYKRGNRKEEDCDEVQLCAQAMALEEMLGVSLKEGALFYGERERRVTVKLDEALRERVTKLASTMHQSFADGITPSAQYEPKCGGCSLIGICKPKLNKGSTARYLQTYLTGTVLKGD